MKRWLIFFADTPDMKPEVFTSAWRMLERYKELQPNWRVWVFQECDPNAVLTEEVLKKVAEMKV